MVTKKKKRDWRREWQDSGWPNKHLGSQLIDQEVAGGFTVWSANMIYLPACLCVYVSKMYFFWALLEPRLVFGIVFFKCKNSCLRSDSYYCWNIHCHNMETCNTTWLNDSFLLFQFCVFLWRGDVWPQRLNASLTITVNAAGGWRVIVGANRLFFPFLHKLERIWKMVLSQEN